MKCKIKFKISIKIKKAGVNSNILLSLMWLESENVYRRVLRKRVKDKMKWIKDTWMTENTYMESSTMGSFKYIYILKLLFKNILMNYN